MGAPRGRSCFHAYSRLMLKMEDQTITKPDSPLADKVAIDAGDAIMEVKNDSERCELMRDMPELLIHSVASKTELETHYHKGDPFLQHQIAASLSFFKRAKEAAAVCGLPATVGHAASRYEQIFQEFKQLHEKCIEERHERYKR